MNTMTGSMNKIFTAKDLEEVDKFNNIFIKNKEHIIKRKDLENMERYILKVRTV